MLTEIDISHKADFMDGYMQQVMLDYNSQDELSIILVEQSNNHRANPPEPIVKVPIKLSDYIEMENGVAYLGFTQETSNLQNVTLIENWSFQSSIKANQKDPWGGLSLDYKCQWPLHLMFSPDVTEKYNNLFRFLLPIKRV